ncbi:hypothetical protein AB840_08710 [Megasphaera cerevisiae DSM 20462]|uniref:ORC1/DEAH AAA+ ATPase domain-containing protein n=2 Tax=Megasphaera TaxID=906 RepID=A0A0J6WWT5_9FIRM|nr:AAA family ATPase [Megasphaera cerevisiae]KMO86302.1 hypothetical protein AB840_08710 [Megasphaera cerevisiae DSM 20462]SKA01157.1 AAA domain-containing protein [Megasphaera cerevisiae DSM 20462]
MSEVGKRGSSRRKGDEYQDNIALRLALKAYIDRKPFDMFLEYEKSGNLDDIVMFQGSDISAYQVKYAINSLENYDTADLLDPESPVSFKKFAASWQIMKQRFPERNLTVCLCSNRGLSSALLDLVDVEGRFSCEVIEERRRGEAKKLRSELASISGLETDSFTEFLRNFKFVLRQPTLSEIEQYIRTVLLDKELGLSDDSIFLDLKNAIKNNAIFSREAITTQTIDNLLERLQSQLLTPQVFPVDQNHFVEQKSLSEQLDEVLPNINGGYLIITGFPGSGKSTSLTMYFDALSSSIYEVFRYYCFVGVNDNAQRMRVQAASLRANLLSEFQRRYPYVLKRRFDYSERNFHECLAALAKFFVDHGRRFIIFLDGLDHAERLESEIRETVISALPADVPEGVTIVVGTQELHKWPHFLKRARECPDSHIKMPLFSEAETGDYLENKRGISGLTYADIVELHKKSEGLPLYLRYAAEIIISSESLIHAIASLTPASGGDIRNYYGLLWEEFERVGMADTKHLCVVMACMRFSVHRDEFYKIAALNRSAFENAYKCICHLLRDSEDRLTVFHNSFREFVINQVPNDWVKEIKINICTFLKDNKDSPRWFNHIFRCCYDAEDYLYILNEVNEGFVDRALLHCRPSSEILDAIHWAVEAAFNQKDIVQLSRLGVLKYRTGERLEYNLNRVRLADALLALGREQDVITFAYSPEANHWLVESHTSLAVMYRLAEVGKFELGRQLFDVFINEFRGVDSDNADDERLQVIGLARCLGIYEDKQARPLRWLAQFNFSPGILEEQDIYVSAYIPHLDAYIDTLVKFGFTDKWNRLKRVKRIFPSRLVKYLLIRAFARHNLINELRTVVSEYWEQEQPSNNVELAFYAAKVGMPVSEVTAIAGHIEAPRISAPDYIPRSDPMLRRCVYAFTIVAYEGNEEAYKNLIASVGIDRTLWNSALRHLLMACHCIGKSFRGTDHNWYEEAQQSINILVQAEQGDGERIAESIDLIRDVMQLSISLLTEQVQKCFPEHLDEWVKRLGNLRDSLLWTTHYGIGESRQDYDFELRIWEILARIPQVSTRLAPILKSCAETYEKSTLLKGGTRSDHFIWLATIMAKCGMRDDADTWLHYGIRSSLIYGYHKDVTLSYLIDVLDLINQRQPAHALERCARVLLMVDWMPHLTDGRETKWFLQMAFESVLKVNRQAALDLLIVFSKNKARWKMQNCLAAYLLGATGGDLEYLWFLTEIFTNHDSEDGAHCKQIMGTKQHIVNLAHEFCSAEVYREFEYRFNCFILTEITPRHWPNELKEEKGISINANIKNGDKPEVLAKQPSEFNLDGERITIEGIAEKCQVAFGDFLDTINKLKNQNEHFYERDLVNNILRHHIMASQSLNDLIQIKEYAESEGRWQDATINEQLAERFMEFGDHSNAIVCFGMAYACYGGWSRWRDNTKYLSAVAVRDKQMAKKFVLKECYETANGAGCGDNTPPIAASGLDVLDEPQMLNEVFDEFLKHCESMFDQLPKKEDYDWLKAYIETEVDTNQIILNFVVDELETSEIDYGERLIRAMVRLAIARPDEVIPEFITRLVSASGRLLHRLMTVFYCLAIVSPKQLAPQQLVFVQFLERENFFCRQTVLRILHCVGKVSPLEASVVNSVQRLEQNYSADMCSLFSLPACPTPIFRQFLKRNTLFDFSKKLEALEKILGIFPGNLVAAIEERLTAQGWSIDDERVRVKDDWYGHVHPQGWPVVWVTTEFQELATEALWSILDEFAIKQKLSKEQINWLWWTIQPTDPEYIFHGVLPRPLDIKPINVHDKERWFNELGTDKDLEIRNTRNQGGSDEWITVFERRIMAQDEVYNVPYKQEISLKGFLVPQQVYGGYHRLNELELWTERILPDSMAVTIKQAQTELTGRGRSVLNNLDEPIPLIAEHENPLAFLGYWSVCTLASFIIKDFNLTFEGLNLIRNGEVVARYEVWQEGYQDECYTRDKLSFGLRLQVRQDLLIEICRRYHKLLCISINEKREYFKSIHRREPDERRYSRRYVLYHLN